MKRNDDRAIAASIAIKQDDMKANPLFTRAYKLYIPFERIEVYVVEEVTVEVSGTPRGLTLTVWVSLHSELRKPPKPPTPERVPSSTMTETYVAHRIIRKLAHWGVWAFFTRFQVINGENMPDSGPVIVWVLTQ